MDVQASEITRLLARARDGDGDAWEAVLGLLYEDLRRIARRVMRGGRAATLSPTGLVHECYLRLQQGGFEVASREQFFALAATAMRRLLLNHARDRMAQKRGGGQQAEPLDVETVAAIAEAEHLVALDQALQRLVEEDALGVRILECRLLAGYTEQESADALGLPLRSLQRGFARARDRVAELLA